jgi:nitrite reductase/ring-hydroxylating ferredoxin subunit/multimeric flavodoxin WrbA
MPTDEWIDLGPIAGFAEGELREMHAGRAKLAVSLKGGAFGAISGVCNHVAGPLGQGRIDGDYVVCPWHAYKFHRLTGEGEPGFEQDRVPRHETKVENGRLYVRAEPATKRNKLPHEAHPLARDPVRAEGPVRVLGISTTAMDPANPRPSTSEMLLDAALGHASGALGAEAQRIALRDVAFRNCEGYYSKSARACTWPCSITQMDPKDGLERVYEALVHWADVVLVATPIRWGSPSSLYTKLVERMNCVQNQITTHGKVLIRDKVAGFVITGGQDGVQAVAGSMLGFFAEIGFVFPPFPFVAHTRGWDAEDMENNVALVQKSEKLRAGARELAARAVELAKRLLESSLAPKKLERGGRKAMGAEG